MAPIAGFPLRSNKAFKGTAVSQPTVPPLGGNNAANGRLRERPPGEIFFYFPSKRIGHKLYPDFYSEISNQELEVSSFLQSVDKIS